MCGIFGIVAARGAAFDNAGLKADLRALLALSEPRGSEATGLFIVLPAKTVVYKRAMPPRRVLSHQSFARYLDDALPEPGALLAHEPVAAIGHCRLATNGSHLVSSNNQPVSVPGLVGVHNGIVTNASTVAGLDSRLLFERVAEEYSSAADVERALARTYATLEGEASIALVLPEARRLALATNTGSLYFHAQPGALVFASERYILETFLRRQKRRSPWLRARATQLRAGSALTLDLAQVEPRVFSLTPSPARGALRPAPASAPPVPAPSALAPPIVDRSQRRTELRRCKACILPETHPFLSFDQDGVCNYCREHVRQRFRGREALLRELERFRGSGASPDCIVAFSGGRDSSYGLHLLKTELGMTPLAFTYDWGLVTDLARRNQARLCGKLGVEHVIRVADIPRQRRYVRQNVMAWLARPRLGMVPLFMAGDKFFYQHARDLRRETGIELVVFCAGNELERTPFKTGFAGVRENNFANRLFGLDADKKVRLAVYYLSEYAKNPRYLNASLFNGLRSFHSTFVGRDDFLYLYDYEPWNEDEIVTTLVTEYDWETGGRANTWRNGDGYTAFINYIYLHIAGFSEFDVFRSNQIREGVIDRERALALCAEDNRPRWDELQEFARVVGLNLEEVLARIDAIDPIRPRA